MSAKSRLNASLRACNAWRSFLTVISTIIVNRGKKLHQMWSPLSLLDPDQADKHEQIRANELASILPSFTSLLPTFLEVKMEQYTGLFCKFVLYIISIDENR